MPYVKFALPWKVDPVPTQDTLVEGATAGAFRVVETPRHTPGHASPFWEERRIVFTGDVAANITAVGPHPAADDPAVARDSFRRLTDPEFEAACFGHGRSITATQRRSSGPLPESRAGRR